MKKIRNFSIIAHIDHGKSTLSDRIIQVCSGLNNFEKMNRILDSMEIEKERGITIKSQSVTLSYKSKDNNVYQLNLIDTPGHIDFSHEVFRSLAICKGVLLIIDSVRGIQAQTLANYYAAKKMQLKIIPVLSKIDLPNSNVECISKDIKSILNIGLQDIIPCSAKTGIGVTNLLEKIVKEIPSPDGNSTFPLQALIIDSWFDNYFGIILLIYIRNGFLKKGDRIKIINKHKCYTVVRLGIFIPNKIDKEILNCGEVGWLICGIKDTRLTLVGNTIISYSENKTYALPKFEKIKPKIYFSIFPKKNSEQENLRIAIEKLSLNDVSFSYNIDNSLELGSGFRCGFLGILHSEVILERIKKEYKLDVIVTAPSITYEILMKNSKILYVSDLSKFPLSKEISEIREPIAFCRIFSPIKYIKKIIFLCAEKRGKILNVIYYTNHTEITYNIPISEIIFNFSDRIKSISCGYASFDYNFIYFKKSDLYKIDVLINKKMVNTLSIISHKKDMLHKGKNLVNRLKKLISCQQFNIIIQAIAKNRVIASTTIKNIRKNVLDRCHGGDVSRKKKLIQNQKIGKKRMQKFNNINIRKTIFFSMLQINKKNK